MAQVTFPVERVERLRESAMLQYQTITDALGITLRQHDPFAVEYEQRRLAECDRIIDQAGWTGEAEPVSLPASRELRHIVHGALYDAAHQLAEVSSRAEPPLDLLYATVAEAAFFAATLRDLEGVRV